MFELSVVGGTFDRLHKGHRQLLDTALSGSKHVLIGLSTAKLYEKKVHAAQIEDYVTRERSLLAFLEGKKAKERVQIIPIDDIFGPTLEHVNIDAIFVTDDNIQTALLINKKRKDLGLSELSVIATPLIFAEDGKSLSSERIRTGEINREGEVYCDLFATTLILPDYLRDKLREPIGLVTKEIQEIEEMKNGASIVITVGDIVSLLLADSGQSADVSIIDFKTQRHELLKHKEELLRYFSSADITCNNKAGMIEEEAVRGLKRILGRYLDSGDKQVFHIKGEEDLLTLPAILLAPLNAVVIYGQFELGAVVVRVTEEKKNEIDKLVKQFVQAK